MTHQPELFPAVHESTMPQRTALNAEELVFARNWKREQERNLLAVLLDRVPTQAEATAAAEVIQWLGSAVGYGFLQKCEREIALARDVAWKARDSECKPTPDFTEVELDETVATIFARDLLWYLAKEPTFEKARETVRRIYVYGKTGRR